MHSVVLYVRERWAATQEDMSRLNRNDIDKMDWLIRWICSGKLTDKNADGLRSRLGLCSIENVLRRGRLCCYSHIQYTDPVTGSKKVDKTIITGSNPRGRRRNTWLECVRNDLKLKGLEALLEKNRIAWCCSLNPKSWCGRDNKGVQHSDTGNNAC